MNAHRSLRSFICATLAGATACHTNPKVTAWTTGEPNAPTDIAPIYRAVLDEIFPPDKAGPRLVVIEQMIDPTRDAVARPPRGSHYAVIAPFTYRTPITFLDTAAVYDLAWETRRADSMAYHVPAGDLLFRQRAAAPFIKRYPGAWGRVGLGRVGFGPDLTYALVDVRVTSLWPFFNSGREIFRLQRVGTEWKVLARTPHEGPIMVSPVPPRMLSTWVDSSLLPAPRRRFVRGTVTDSASGTPLSSMPIRIQSSPLGKHGEILRDKWPVPWGIVFTDSGGEFAIPNPPSGYASIEVVCPPSRGVAGGGLFPVSLEPQSGLDTVFHFRVRYAACAEMAPLLAAAAKRHLEDVARAKVEAAARAVQGNIHGTLRDVSTGRPVPRAPIRVDERGGIGFSDSLGAFWLWGFAPGNHKIIVRCPTRRGFLAGRVATSFAIHAPPRMNDTFDIRIDMQGCVDPDVATAKVRTRGVWSTGFEDGFFTPCEKFTQIPLGAYEDWSHLAYLGFAAGQVDPLGGWPHVKPEKNGSAKFFLDVEGDLSGPGSYGHLGIATYLLKVTRVVSAKPASEASCARQGH